jgi:CubicO group peptidase (beta-lactamase class C family)
MENATMDAAQPSEVTADVNAVTFRRLARLECHYRGVLFGAAMAVVALLPAATAWSAPAAPATLTQAGLTTAACQQAITTHANEGLRLVSISGYIENGGVRCVGVWRKVAGPAQFARFAMMQADYDKEGVARGKDGYTLVSVTPFGNSGETLFNAIWEKRPSPVLYSRYGMTGAEYLAWSIDRTKAGMHLTQISGYTINGQARFAAIFEGGASLTLVTQHAMTSDDLNSKIATYQKQGYRLKQLSGYQDGGQDRFAAIWDKPAGGALWVRWGVNAADFQRVGDVERLRGWSPLSIQGYSAGSAPRFTMLFETPFRNGDLDLIVKAVNDGLAARMVAGASVAIAKDGKLVYAAGFGKANLQTGELMDVRHRIRIGSVSKMITSAAIYKLVEDGKLSGVNRNVFGPGGILEKEVTLVPLCKDLEGASIQQFLQHLSGLPGTVPDPVNCSASGAAGNATLTARIQQELANFANARPVFPTNRLLGKPGDFNAYSNMSHIIAGAVIEKLSGRSYLDYVRSRVLVPAGLPASGPLAPALFTTGNYNPASGEAGHYDTGGAYASYAATSCSNEPPGVGAGGWAMSAVDLLRWFTSIDAKPGRVPELLSAADQKTFTTAGVPKNPASGAPYASGIVVNGTWGFCGTSVSVTQGHNGGVAGASSNLWLFGNGYAIAVIVNQDTATSAPCPANDTIINNLLGVVTKIDWPDTDQF